MPTPAPVYSKSRPARLWVRLESISVEKLDRYAEHRGITRAGLLHLIVEQWLEMQPDMPEGPPTSTKRRYAQSYYMRERQQSREQAALMETVAQAVSRVQKRLETRFQETNQTLQEAERAIQEIAKLKETN